MIKEVSIVFEYDEYIDIRFFSNFLYHLKAISSYLYTNENGIKDDIDKDINKFVNKPLENILAHTYVKSIFEKYKYKNTYNSYNLFILEKPKIKILKAKEGSIELLITGISLSVVIISSAVAYKVIKSKKVDFEIPKIIKVKINND